MCGIVGYIGNRNAQEVLMQGLRRLEYRGYDCLSPDTLVQLENGSIRTIQETEAGSLLSSINLQNLHFSKGKVGLKGAKEKRSLYKIRTSVFEIESSRDHRFFVYKDGRIVEKRAFELRPGDFLMSSRKIEIKGTPQKLPQLQNVIYYQLMASGVKIIQQIRQAKNLSYNFIERKTGIHHQYAKDYLEGRRATQKHNWKKLFGLLKVDPSFLKTKSSVKVCSHSFQNNFKCSHLNPILSQIIGYLLGDGSRLVSKIDRKIKIEDDCQTLEIYQDLFKKIKINSKLLKHRHKNCWQMRIYSAAFGKLLNEIAPGILNSSSKREVPEIVMKSPLPCVAGFLKGLLDAEGSVGKRKRDGISIFSGSKKLLRQIQLLLLRFGIVSIPYNGFNRISIWDYENLKRFSRFIGFSSPKKEKRLKDLLILRSGKRKGQVTALTPLSYKDLKKKMPLANISSSAGFVSTYVLRKIYRRIRPLESYREFSNFTRKYFLNPFIFWTRIKTIERSHSKHLMFDFTIPITQNFIANGLVVHNSAGLAILSDKIGSKRATASLQIKKRAGKLHALEALLAKNPIKGKLGISHVRWATHGIPNTKNAHPHWDCRGKIALVHNGIIENYEPLKESLVKEGHKFRSQTDTEVLVHLVEKFYRGCLEEAVTEALRQVSGAYAIAVICKDEPEKLVGARLGSPLIASAGENEGFLASDIPALLDYTKEVVLLDDKEIAVLTPRGLEVRNLEKNESLSKKKVKVNWDAAQAEKEGFPHFMLKEIHEQPRAIRNTLLGRISKEKDAIILPELAPLEKTLASMEKIVIISCGTAWHAGLVGKYILEEYARIPVEVDISSEFRYRNPILNDKSVVVAITQSGETADTLAGLREAKSRGAKILSICNVLGSSIPRESDAVIYTHAGPEIAVASTKAYTCQLAVLYLLTFYLAKLRNTISGAQLKQFILELGNIPQALEKVLANKKVILQCARRYYHAFGFLYLGRSLNFPTALEGALKIKEISYMHAEGYGAGEMKHGPIALINPHLPVVCIAPESRVHEKMLSNIQEIKARRGIVISLASEGDRFVASHSNHVIYLPKVKEPFSPFLTVVPLQLLAYYIAAKRGCDIDQPKNLAKSVTVE